MNKRKKIDAVKRIAVIAHDNKKTDLIDWSYLNRHLLSAHEIIAAGTAADILEGTLNRPVTRLLNGPLGIDKQVSTLITEGKVDILIFFWNHGEHLIHESDVTSLVYLAYAYDIAIAFNKTSADFIIHSGLMNLENACLSGEAVTEYAGTNKRRQ